LFYSEIKEKNTARSRITFDTFWRIEIFWSESFYTITLTKFINWFSLPATHSIQFYRIRRVKLTIL